jgi:hypothetical protein
MRRSTPIVTSQFFKADECTLFSDDFDTPFVMGRDNKLIKLFHYYQSLPRLIYPSAQDITLIGLASTGLLGLTHVVDVTPLNPLAYEFTIYGGKATLSHGKDMAQKTIGDLPYPKYREFVVSSYTSLLKARKPIFSQVITRQLSYIRAYRRLLLPLADDYRDISHVLVASSPDNFDIANEL